MQKTLDFPDLLRLIDERSTAFRAAVAAAPSLDVQVPTCPEWTLFDLVQHLGGGAAPGPPSSPRGLPTLPRPRPSPRRRAGPREREALLAWLAASTQELLDALREAGPDRGCWTWWGKSQSPQTSGAAARHQLQEIAVHTYDAQLTVGAPQPLPDEVALDGVEEFLSTCCTTTVAWPHEPLPSITTPPRAAPGASLSTATARAHPHGHRRDRRRPGRGRRLRPRHGQ